MTYKKWKIISPFILFGLCSILHFGYTIMPNPVSAIFFPVNESIFEHMKMIYTSVLVFSLIEYFVIKKMKWEVHNIGINPFLSGLTNIFSFLFIYLIIIMFINETMIVTFIILFISNIIASFVSYYLLLNKQILSDKMGLILTIMLYIPFIYFTYYPMHNSLFYDPKDELYGIPKK